MTRWKAMPWLLGVALLAFSLVAAKRLLDADTPVNGGGGGGHPAPANPGKPPVGGLTVVGTVDSDPPVARIDAPGVIGMPALTVARVPVKEGDAVKEGDVLVEFDPSAFLHDLTAAEKELLIVQWKAVEAKAGKDDHAHKLELQTLAVDTAEKQFKQADDLLTKYKAEFERILAAETTPLGTKPLTEEAKERRRGIDPDLNKYTALVTELKAKVEKEKIELKRLQAVPVDAPVAEVNAQAEAVQAKIAKAKAVIESFKLRAKMAGTVERLTAEPGMSFGPTTREPLLYLVPTGRRIVHAEVEAEFAHKIDAYVGKRVTVCDAHNFAHTYSGVAVRVGGAFLPKRSGGDGLVAPARVLECTIEVSDPSPAGRPPLRPGQPVRVVFGQ